MPTGAYRRSLANTIERLLRGGDAAFYRITLTTCLDCRLSTVCWVTSVQRWLDNRRKMEMVIEPTTEDSSSVRFGWYCTSTSTLAIPSTRPCTTLGDRAFPVTAARAWNALPSSVRSAPSLLQFRRDGTACFSHRTLHHSVQLCNRL